MIRQCEFLQELIELHRVPDRVLDRVGHVAHSPLFQQPPVDRHLPVLRRQRQHEQRFILHAGVQHGLADARRIRQAAVQRDKQPVAHPQARLGRRADDEIRHVVPEDQRAQVALPRRPNRPPLRLRKRLPRQLHQRSGGLLVHGVRREVHIHLRLCRRVRAHRHGAEQQKRRQNSFHAHPLPLSSCSIYTRVWGKACFKVF